MRAPTPLPPRPAHTARRDRAASPQGHPDLRAADEPGEGCADAAGAARFPRRGGAPWRPSAAPRPATTTCPGGLPTSRRRPRCGRRLSRRAADRRRAGGPRERPARCGPPTSGRRAQPGVARDDCRLDYAGERATGGHRGGPGGATLPAGRSSSPAGRSSPHTVAGSGRERVTSGIGREWPTSWSPRAHRVRLVRAVPLCAATCASVSPTGRRAVSGTAASSARDPAAGGGGALSGDVSP
jgi:hypothetical protein